MNILLVSDDENFAVVLKEKLVFLRKDDNVRISDYEHAFENLNSISLVLVHQNTSNEATLQMIKNLRVNQELCLLFVANSYDSGIILSAIDCGADDFVLEDADDFEYVIRIINNIKHYSVRKMLQRDSMLLKKANVVDEYSNIYNYEYCRPIVENCINSSFKKFGTFMVISPCDKVNFSFENAVNVIKSTLRTGDIAFLTKGINFYIYLPETDCNGAVLVFNKIKSNIDIRAGISDITNKSFNEFERDALAALSDAFAANKDFIVAKEKEDTLDEWLSDAGSGGNYKLFRKVFNKKLEKVIAPVFYRLQKIYEEKLFETKIEQYTNSEQCVFKLKNKTGESLLRIVYPGFAKIMIYIEHEGLDSPENRDISLKLDKVTQKELIKIVESFIEEFKETKCYQ